MTRAPRGGPITRGAINCARHVVRFLIIGPRKRERERARAAVKKKR